ncbi:MAG: hypothetical protein U0K57_05645 [Lachnospiraceae bacterium]|nr:hypothetical protein [Lachnospiraceae bacterium]
MIMRQEKYGNLKRGILGLAVPIVAVGLLIAGPGGQGKVSAKSKVVYKCVTPKEPQSSDLKVRHTVTKLKNKRWIQSYTKDDRYYYYIQATNPYKGHLTITRVKYKGLGKYSRAYMYLRYFGHATNLDCSVSNGVTYLWTGSNAVKGKDTSRAISAFPFQKNAKLYYQSNIMYQIPYNGKGKYVTNVYPAISADGTELTVRYTRNNMQYYQTYPLSQGLYIDPSAPTSLLVTPPTKGAFQGFDVKDAHVYTIEGSPRKSFLRGYDRRRKYEPTKVRIINKYTGIRTCFTIHGAKRLSFREPEGIKIQQDGQLEMMYVSHKLENMRANIYLIKR